MQLSSVLLCLWAAVFVSAQQASSSARIGVTGVKSAVWGSGKRASRKGINGLQRAGGPAWDLYIQALAAFQAVPESQQNSYFQIVGIHGLPYVSWNGVGQVAGGGGGYCPHGEITFPSWHRPFLALFEQALCNHAARIAATYKGSDKAKYVNEAKYCRIPYWDWAADPKLPGATTTQYITVKTPSGKKSIRNPLFSYRFQKFPFTYANFGGTIGQYSQTLRCPSTNDRNAVSQLGVVNQNLARDAGYLKDSVYLTFTRSNDFVTMSNDGSGGYNFEAPHNNIHNDIGCGNPTGHMTNLGWSAFDPIFWLHHANVDRLIAIWQGIHPSEYTFGGTYRTNSARYGVAAGTSFSATTGLKPFYRPDKKNFWTSSTAKSTKAFGYTYPEIRDWEMSSTELQRSLISKVNQLYGSNSLASTNSLRRRDDGTVTQYMAEISVDREDLQLPSTINMYLGEELAGSVAVLSMPMTGRTFGNIPLQQPLDSLSSDLVESPQDSIIHLLKTALRVEMVTPDGTTKSILDVPSMKVDLEISVVQPPATEFEFPQYLNNTKVPVQLKELVDAVVGDINKVVANITSLI
jgi:tyrosinase